MHEQTNTHITTCQYRQHRTDTTPHTFKHKHRQIHTQHTPKKQTCAKPQANGKQKHKKKKQKQKKKNAHTTQTNHKHQKCEMNARNDRSYTHNRKQ